MYLNSTALTVSCTKNLFASVIQVTPLKILCIDVMDSMRVSEMKICDYRLFGEIEKIYYFET